MSYLYAMHFLEKPFFYNHIRSIIAGNQQKTKDFVKAWLVKTKSESMLDVGCGTGDFFYPDLNISYCGIDAHQPYISFAQRKYARYPQAKFVCGDFLSSSFNGKHYDGIICISIMHHFSDEDIQKIFSRIVHLAPKIVIIADIIPNPPNVLGKLAARLDRGKYIRQVAKKNRVVRDSFQIIHTESIPSRLAVQHGIVCIPRNPL